jgi:hypothetical protein
VNVVASALIVVASALLFNSTKPEDAPSPVIEPPTVTVVGEPPLLLDELDELDELELDGFV